MKRLVVAGVVCAVLALSTAACADDDSLPEDEVTNNAGELCTDLDELKADTDKLAGLDPASATKEQVEDAYSDVRDDWDEAQDNVSVLDSARKDAVRKAMDDLKSAYDAIPDNAPVPQVLDGVRSQVKRLATTVAGASSSLKCPRPRQTPPVR